MTVLLADIGGTNSRMALAFDGVIRDDLTRSYKNAGHAGFDTVITTYLQDVEQAGVDAICVAMAGPVKDNAGQMTNLDWDISPDMLKRASGAKQAHVLNDLQAQGFALAGMEKSHINTLQDRSAPASATQLVVGVGTGFNAAPVFYVNNVAFVPPSESGHMTLPLQDEQDLKLRVGDAPLSVEKLLSGVGISHAYRVETGQDIEPAEVLNRCQQGEKSAHAAMTTVCTFLGRVTGNLSLSFLSFGGIYLVGGVARKLAPFLPTHGFMAGFTDKGRFSDFMDQFPIHVVTDDHAALDGCLAYLKTSQS